MTPRRARARLAGAAAVLAVGGLITIPVRANAIADDVGALGTGFNGFYTVSDSCEGVIGAATSLSTVTYVINAEGSAGATNGAVPVAVSVTCSIVDVNTGAVYGTASGGLSGPADDVPGIANVPLGSSPQACVSARALFSDGGSASAGPTCGVTPSAINPSQLGNTLNQTVERLRCRLALCPGPAPEPTPPPHS